MFGRLSGDDGEASGRVEIRVDGRPVAARAGDSVAGALLAAGVRRFRRSPVTGAPRAPYCMMGICFECLVTIDGQPGRQACMIAVAPGMDVRTAEGDPDRD
ncbi:MAG: (2Fe-2S)-binding protein [Rhodobacteraceae bacterium]|nr:(2Fe-2S)-binding protein [Paracoccaceae bacterium]